MKRNVSLVTYVEKSVNSQSIETFFPIIDSFKKCFKSNEFNYTRISGFDLRDDLAILNALSNPPVYKFDLFDEKAIKDSLSCTIEEDLFIYSITSASKSLKNDFVFSYMNQEMVKKSRYKRIYLQFPFKINNIDFDEVLSHLNSEFVLKNAFIEVMDGDILASSYFNEILTPNITVEQKDDLRQWKKNLKKLDSIFRNVFYGNIITNSMITEVNGLKRISTSLDRLNIYNRFIDKNILYFEWQQKEDIVPKSELIHLLRESGVHFSN
ncbi:hypothetical protein [Spirochaeta cellobiosiphila]|uniref:hypothetical protein n=1 Tax=Spirochaeta cellobiosiphila TaxID=504483 RepID=UPI0003FA30D1|nr:hypothetical protein [Spirochaeta cellobiosiphila]